MIRSPHEIMQEVIMTAKPHSIDPFKLFENMTTCAEKAIKEAMIEAIWETVGNANQMVNAGKYDSHKLAWDLINQIDPTLKKINQVK